MFSDWKPSYTLLTIASAAVVITGTTMFFLWWQKKRRTNGAAGASAPRQDFVEVGKLKKIIIYPVKSLGGIEVQSAFCTKLGLKVGPFNDRSWLVVRENGSFLTQRQEPSLVLVKPSFHDKDLWLEAPDMETLKVKLKEVISKNDKQILCRVWGNEIMAVDCGDEAALWFQTYLKQPGIRLVQHCVAEQKPRECISKGVKFEFNRKDYPLIFADQAGYMFANEASLEDLNARISEDKKKVSYRNFRPNLLISGNKPFEEDNWRYIQVGEDATFLQIVPCTRCQMTTIDPDTGIKGDNEPLDTLRTFRLSNDEFQKPIFGTSPLFGAVMGLEIEGIVEVGDPVFAVLGSP